MLSKDHTSLSRELYVRNTVSCCWLINVKMLIHQAGSSE